MYFENIRVLNYKSFKDSGWVSLGKGFNVVIGQNNSGKTAFLESFNLGRCAYHPHYGPDTLRNAPPLPRSMFEFDLIISGQEIKSAILRNNEQFLISVPPHFTQNEYSPYLNSLFNNPTMTMRLKAESDNAGYSCRNYPSHGLFTQDPNQQQTSYRVQASPDRQSVVYMQSEPTSEESFLKPISSLHPQNIFIFKAERLNIGVFQPTDSPDLNPNAANLPGVLGLLQGKNPHRFERFNQHVRTIFPNIKHIGVVNAAGSMQEIRVWSIDKNTERDDLAFKLTECGTGVGQVLAILYIVMNMPEAVIVIDEPNSFLHPGAAKKLVEILREYTNHQFIISTHAPELILACKPSTLHLIRWENGESKITPISKSGVESTKEILNEVGVGLSEVFGADSIIWVEGPTEKACFPIILEHAGHKLPLGMDIVALRNTGDLEAHYKLSVEAWFEIYEKLTTANALIPPTIAFSLDRETRTAGQMDEIIRRSHNTVSFIPRRQFENYLLHPQALHAFLTTHVSGESFNQTQIETWVQENLKNVSGDCWDDNWKQSSWVRNADAAKLLHSLVGDISEGKLEYRKIQHGEWLTRWILEHDPVHLDELKDYLVNLMSSSSNG